jgi:hypothetical protein
LKIRCSSNQCVAHARVHPSLRRKRVELRVASLGQRSAYTGTRRKRSITVSRGTCARAAGVLIVRAVDHVRRHGRELLRMQPRTVDDPARSWYTSPGRGERRCNRAPRRAGPQPAVKRSRSHAFHCSEVQRNASARSAARGCEPRLTRRGAEAEAFPDSRTPSSPAASRTCAVRLVPRKPRSRCTARGIARLHRGPLRKSRQVP